MFCARSLQGLRVSLCPGSRRGPFKERVLGGAGGPGSRKRRGRRASRRSALRDRGSLLRAGARSSWVCVPRRVPGARTPGSLERASTFSEAPPSAGGRGSASLHPRRSVAIWCGTAPRVLTPLHPSRVPGSGRRPPRVWPGLGGGPGGRGQPELASPHPGASPRMASP